MKLIPCLLYSLMLYTVTVNAQCTFVIPSTTTVISNDTVVDCSFIPGNNFLICTGASLTMTGNSTCMNHFYMEDASVVTFRDSLPGAPYGIFSFFIKGIAILDFNDDSPVSFGIIDTLVYEPSALLLDTGSIFQYTNICPSVVFDYSLLPAGNPCAANSIAGAEMRNNFIVAPVPFSEDLGIQIAGEIPASTILIYDIMGKEVEKFDINEIGQHHLKMKNSWSGVAYIQIMQKGEVVCRKMITRIN